MRIQTYEEPKLWTSGTFLKPSIILEKEDVHAQHLLHQSVHLLLLDQNSRFYCRKRCPSEQRYPGMLTTTIGAHVELGRGYYETLEHLLPHSLQLHSLGEFRINDEFENEICGLYTATLEETLPEEFRQNRFFLSLKSLELFIEKHQTTPHLAAAYYLIARNKHG